MGFIHFLTVIIPLANLDLKGKKWDGFSSCIRRGDKSLREFLDCVSLNQETMKTLLLDHIPPEYQSQIKPLSQFLSIGNKSSTESVLFSKDSVKEFHCLVIGAFMDQEVDTTLFYVERSRLVIPTGSWLTLKAMMEELFVSDPSNNCN